MSVSRSDYDTYLTPNYAPVEMVPVRGRGSHVWDQNDKQYVDFAGGIAVNSLGHCHPMLVDVLCTQAQTMWHVSNIYTNEPALRLAKKLVAKTFAEQVFFANSGAEANEAALKLARRYALEHFGAEKDQIIAFGQGFHGRTFFTVTVGGQAAYSDGFGPKPGSVIHATYNDLDSLAAVISDRTCAVMLEPIQGEGGVVPGEREFLQGVRALCDKHQALMIIDEVQTGMGRTGKLFAHEHFAITPDILTSAKSLGGGFPIGAMLTTKAIGASLKPGTHGTTYGGNPLACAVAEKVLDIVSSAELLAGIAEKHARLQARFTAINEQYPMFSELRGMGLLLGAVLKPAYHGQAKAILDAALTHGLMCLIAGANVVRFAPALNISLEDIDEGMDCFTQAVAQVYASQR